MPGQDHVPLYNSKALCLAGLICDACWTCTGHGTLQRPAHNASMTRMHFGT